MSVKRKSFQLTEKPELSARMENYLQVVSTPEDKIGLERAVLITESYKKTEPLLNCLRRAKAVENILNNMSIEIEPYTLIAGNFTECGPGRTAPLFPEIYSSEMAERVLLKGDPIFPWEKAQGEERWTVDDEQEFKDTMQEILPYWKGRTAADAAYALIGEKTFQAQDFNGVFVFNKDWYFNYGDGHFIHDFPYHFKYGLKHNIERCQQKLKELDTSQPDAVEKRAFWEAVIISNQAVIDFIKRYASLAAKMSEKETDTERKKELKIIAENCDWITENPPHTFHQAVQLAYFIQLVVHIEDAGHSVSYGRLDQYLWPFYKQDLKSNNITREEALELIENLFIKTWQIGKWRCEEDSKYSRGKPLHENLTIGGIDYKGQDTSNELSHIMIDAKYNVRLAEPQLTARWHPNAPDEYKLHCARLLRLGLGQPALFNDLCIPLAMMRIGYELEEAYDYGIVGCSEPHPAGKIGGGVGGPVFNVSKVVELVLHGGRDPRTGICLNENINKKDLSTFTSFSELWEAFVDQVGFYHGLLNELNNAGEVAYERYLDEPLASSLGGPRYTIESGKGFKKGGSKYDWNAHNAGAFGTAANIMAALKKLVFDEKKLSGKELLHAIETNFEDMSTEPTGPQIRNMCIKAPKFGNDDDYVDFIARDVLEVDCDSLIRFKTIRSGRGPKGCISIPSTNSINANVVWAKTMKATPDGRKDWQAPSETLSPAQGELGPSEGITAVINSVTKYPYTKVSNGALTNYKMSPSDVEGEEGLRRLVHIIDTCFLKNGFHMQFNIVDRETLVEAQENPEKYRDLMVRVAGYSARFVELDKDVQNDIINRVTLSF